MNMSNNRYILYLCFLLIAFACDNGVIEESVTGQGKLNLSLSSENVNNFVSVITKSGEEKVSSDSMKVSILNSKGELVAEFDSFKEMKENKGEGLPMTLPVGTYVVKAWYDNAGEPSKVPYLYGEQVFDITYNTLTRVNLICEYQCIKVMLQTASAFDAICKDTYKVRLTTSENETVELDKGNYWIFFRKPCDTMQAWVDVETVDGRSISFSYDLEKKDSEPFQWKNSIIIKLDIQNTKSLNLETEIL